ncbi:hypothetical protein DY000_02006787 [Brassica cretica]|uniref:Uncharacterized protein n=1 Tax=Brassica cretica TaxID=69181 RepID=A0ABQ7C8X0_BRACR|nr:hypothetical protein DY000_02006787 [Brassica cretica]
MARSTTILAEENRFGIYQIDDDVLSDLEQQVDFIDSPNLEDRHHDHETDSFTRNYDATVGSRRGRARFRLNQAFTGNLDGQVAENATTIKRETGRLPGRTDTNPRLQVNAVLLRSGKRLTPNTVEITSAEKPTEAEKTGESRSRPILLDDPDPGSKPSREKEQSNTEKTEKAMINLDDEEEESEEDVEIDRRKGNNVDRSTTINIDRQTGNNVDRHQLLPNQ